MKYLIVLITLTLNCVAQDNFEDQFNETRQLTDKEAYDAVRFENDERNQRMYDESCEAFNQRMKTGSNGVKIHGQLNDCTEASADAVGQSFGGSAGATLEAMVPVVSKMYSMVLGMPGMSKITSTLNQQKDIARAYKSGKDSKINNVDEKYGVKTSDGDILSDGKGGTFYKTDKPGYVADKDGNIFKKGADGNYAACGEECADVKKDYKKKKEKKEQEDWCAKVPMATELIAGATQVFKEANIEQRKLEGSDIQRNSLYALKDTHSQRSKTAQIQAAGWFATSGCYLGYITKGFVSGQPVNWTTYLKLGASGFLGTFYQLKVKKHKEYAAQVDSLIAELPKRGECNPHTDTHCFCAEESSKNVDPASFQRYCVPPVYSKTGVLDPMSCVTKDMQVDNNCDCKKSQSCISHELTRTNPIGIDMGTSYMTDALKDMSAMNRGDYGSANLANSASAKNARAIGNALKKGEASVPTTSNSKDAELVRKIMASGIPRNIANRLANTKANPLALEMSRTVAASLSKDTTPESKIIAKDGDVKISSSRFSNPSAKKESSVNPFALFNKKSNMNNGGGKIKVLEFQQAATNNADITKNSGANIFEIISNRYTASAYKKFDVKIETNNKEKK